MSKGSSRSLIKSLEQLFRDSKAVESLPDTTATTLAEYIERHDTFSSMNNNKLSDELYHIFKEFVVDNEAKECGFLDVLATLAPFIVETKELMLWVDRYFPPAVNSAGKATRFVSKSRRFIESILDFGNSPDQRLQSIRQKHSEIVLRRLLDTCLLMTNTSVESQESEERERFIRMNARQLVKVFSDMNIKVFFDMLDGYVRAKETRLAALTLLTTIASPSSTNFHEIANTELLDHIFSCALLDIPVQLVSVAVSLLCLIIPHIPVLLGRYLPQLFAVYARLVAWDSDVRFSELVYDDSTPKLEKEEPNFMLDTWDPIEGTVEGNDFYSPEYRPLFVTVYSLFPRATFEFVQDPSSLFGVSSETKFKLQSVAPKVKVASQEILKSLVFNDELMNYVSSYDEVSDAQRYAGMSPEEVSFKAIALDTSKLSSPMPARDIKKGSVSLSRLRSRESSVTGGFQFKTPTYELKEEAPTSEEQHPLSKASSDYYNSQPNSLNDINGLLNTHKMLFSKNESQQTEFLRRFSVQSGIDDTLSNPETKEEQPSTGTQLQFYQRELLISLNEQEFLSHSNHLIVENLKKSKQEQASLLRKLQDSKALELTVAELQATNKELLAEIQAFKAHSKSNERHILKTKLASLNEEHKALQLQLSHYKELAENSKIEAERAIEQYGTQQAEMMSLTTAFEALKLEREKAQNAVGCASESTSERSSVEPQSAVSLVAMEEELDRTKLVAEMKISELERRYETKVGRLQDEIAQLRASGAGGESIKIVTARYEAKIGNLNAKIVSLQSAIQEKEEELMKVTTTQPINIPAGAISANPPIRPVLSSGASAFNIRQGPFNTTPFSPGPPSEEYAHFLRTPTLPHQDLAWSPDAFDRNNE